jgi:hypothetical protein
MKARVNKLSVFVFWVKALCGLADKYQYLEGKCYLHLQPLRWKQYIPPKHRYLPKRPYVYNPKDQRQQFRRRENLKSRIG